jgi:hypothetical protein
MKKNPIDPTLMASAARWLSGTGVSLTEDRRLSRKLRARREGIYEEPLGSQMILFDSATRESVSLNPVAAFVWSRCNGRMTLGAIVEAFARVHPNGQSEAEVLAATDLLAKNGLLLDENSMPVVPVARSRRTILTYGALTAKAAIAFSLIGSFLRPSNAEAGGSSERGKGHGHGNGPKPRNLVDPFGRKKKKTKHRKKRNPNRNHNNPKPGDPDPVDCYGGWGEWGPCDFFMQAREYTVMVPAANGGLACEVEDGTIETQDCGAPQVDCAGTWGPWGSCSVSCGDGMKTRNYNITTPAANGGAACPASPESQSCAAPPCPVVCQNCFEASDRCQPDGSCIHLCPDGGVGDCCSSQDGGATFFNDC